MASFNPSSQLASADALEIPEPAFTSCPRAEHSEGHTDWLTISDSRFGNFDICPTCFNASINPTQYRRFFVQAAPKPPNVATKCDFSEYWVRVAWTWVMAGTLPDASLLAMVAETNVAEGPCPNTTQQSSVPGAESATATRMWYTIQHPDTLRMMDEFTICSYCLANIDTIYPVLRGSFIPASPSPCSATCDLVLGTPRCCKYLDALTDAAVAAQATGFRDLRPLA